MILTLYQPVTQARRIKFHVPYYAMDWRSAIKNIPTRVYHKDQQLWSIRNEKPLLEQLKQIAGTHLRIQPSEKTQKFKPTPLPEHLLDTLAAYEQKLILRAYSLSTISSYKMTFTKFLASNKDKDIDNLTKTDLEQYVYNQIVKYKISESKQNIIINALKFYYEKVLGKPRTLYELQRPKSYKSLPNTLSEKEVIKLLRLTTNLKHKCILSLMYSGGLRLSEIINLRIADIRSDDMTIFVKGAKGKKDRQTILSQQLLKLLRIYFIKYRPAYWLIEGSSGGQYSRTSINKLFRTAAKRANIPPWSTPHTLRHSFATHLMQQGVNLRYIQTLLGHSSPKTTEIYTHVIKVDNKVVKSPLDRLLEKELS